VTVIYLQPLNAEWKEQIEQLKRDFPGTRFVTEKHDQDSLLDAEVIVGSHVSAEQIDQAKKLKAIIVPISGITHLPLDKIISRGIRVANTHGNARYVAERAVALILAFYGKIVEYHNDLVNERWHGFWVGKGLDDTWDSIHGKRVSILGAGEIGKWLARFLSIFDVELIGYKRTPVDTVPPPFARMVYSVDEALTGADMVVIALPLTSHTRGLLGRRELEKMRGKVLVNVGRADVVDEKALYDALKEGVLTGAALDPWYTYPDGKTSGAPAHFPIHTLPNVVLSPHTAGFTAQAASENIRQANESVRRFLSQGELLYETSPADAY